MWTRTRIRLLDFVIFLTVFLSVTLCSEVKVSIRPENEHIQKPAGTTFVVTCVGDAEKPTLFTSMKWIGNQGEITDDINAPMYVTQDAPGNLFLYFNNPTAEMTGRYNCSALYDNSVTKESSVYITFYHAVTFENCPLVQALVIGTSGDIRCRANANPNAKVDWVKGKDGKEQLDMSRFQIQNEGIHVTDVQESDAGLYRMRAVVQETGEVQWKYIEVEVHVPPVITDLKERLEVIEGERTEIHCQASGNPPPQYDWISPLRRNLSSEDGYIVDRRTGILTIRDVRKEMAGVYVCQATNSANKAEKNLELAVLVKPVIRQFMNVTQVVEKDTKLECRSFGDPAPDMAIRKDGVDEPIASGDDRMRVERFTDGDESVLRLTIQRTDRTDDGLYYCSATNRAGRAEQVGHVTVEFPPDMKNTPATERKTWRDNPVNLTCIADAIPNATITWYFRGEQIHPNRVYTIFGTASHSSLLVRPSQNEPGGANIYGKYRCEGRNQFGNASIEINLQEAHVPGRLQQISLGKQTATTISFQLRALTDDGGLPLSSYVIRYREAGSHGQEENTFEWPEGSSTSYILEGLKPRTEYFFRFAAKNDAGIGEFSEEQKFITPTESAPEMPSFVTPGGNVSRYPDEFQVRWTIPQDNGKPIIKFTLRYFQIEWVNNDWKSVGKDSTVDIRNWESGARYKITGLKPNSHYKVEVRAENEIGYSQPASQIFQTPAGSTTKEQRTEDGSILTTPAIVALVIVVVLVVLGLLDVTCYMRYQCGLLYCLRTSVCGRSHASDKAKEAVEDGKGGKDLLANANNGLKAKVDAPVDPDLNSDKERREEFRDGPNEDTPMIESVGAKDTKNTDVNSGDYKNKSPKGSKSSIAKDSLV